VAARAAARYLLPVFVHRRLALLAAVAGLIGTTSCSGAANPKTLPPLSPSPTASATATDPSTDLAAASHVVRTYFNLKNHLGADMSTAPFEAIETASCECRRFLQSIRQVRSRRQHFFGAARVRALTPVRDSASQVEVLALYDTTAGGTKDENGHVVFQDRGRLGVEALFKLRTSGSEWQIDDIATVKAGVPN
jgi:hypothetical protein